MQGRDGVEAGHLGEQRPVAARQHAIDGTGFHPVMIGVPRRGRPAGTAAGCDSRPRAGRSGVSIAGRFETALVAASEPQLAGPELLPVRLARAVARTLRVDGGGPQPRRRRRASGYRWERARTSRRRPSDCSSPSARGRAWPRRRPVSRCSRSSRTSVGAGPGSPSCCSTPPRTGPSSHCRCSRPGRSGRDRPLLHPVRGRAGPGRLRGGRGRRAGHLRPRRRRRVVDLVARARGPDWLRGPAPQRRAAVWEAMGKVSVDLEVGRPGGARPAAARGLRRGTSVDDVAARAALRNACGPTTCGPDRGVSPRTAPRRPRPPPAPPAPRGRARRRRGCRRARRPDSTATPTGVPSTATTTPSAAMRTARSATAAASFTSAPGLRARHQRAGGGVAAVGEPSATARSPAAAAAAAAPSRAGRGPAATRS